MGADLAAVAECETATQQKFGDRLSATRSQSYYLDTSLLEERGRERYKAFMNILLTTLILKIMF